MKINTKKEQRQADETWMIWNGVNKQRKDKRTD